MMLDLAAPKVATPAIIFMLSQLDTRTRHYAFLIVPLFTWLVVKFVVKMNMTPADVIVPGVLAGLLSLVPLPVDYAAGTVIKGLMFLFIFAQLRITFPQYY
jgi:hypothetical protein